jgi:hypothetical protein
VHEAVLKISAADELSGVKRISAVLYDETDDKISEYYKFGKDYSENAINEDGSLNSEKTMKNVEETWTLNQKGAQLSIFIAVSDWAGNTFYYDQTGAKINPAGAVSDNDPAEGTTLPADYAAAEKVFKETRKLGENTFIVYGTPAVIVKTNETKDAIEATIDGEKKHIFQDLSSIELNFSDMAGKASLEFNGTEYLEGEYNVEKHEYVYNSVALKSVEGENTFKLIVPQGTSVKTVDKEFSDEPYVAETKEDNSVTYEGSFMFDNIAPSDPIIKITKTENKFFGLISLKEEAEFGDLTSTDDGAVIVTNKDVTFTLEGATEKQTGLKVAGIYASPIKLTETDVSKLQDN